MNFLDAKVSEYMRGLADRYDEDVLIEMEQHAEQESFPIVGRSVGITLELLARSVGARRVFEMGSGYGYSGYWFARAVGEGGKVTLTDGDKANREKAEKYLSRAGFWERCEFHVGDAFDVLSTTGQEFDVVYCDIDKGDYPRAFESARQRVRVGGLYICDNVLWSGRVASDDSDEWTQAIRRQNEMIAADESFISTIVPIRDGVVVALRLS